MNVIGFLCVSLGSSTVQLHDGVGSRRTCACSEICFGSRNGDRAWEVYYRKTKFLCALFCGENNSMLRIFIKKCFLFTVGSVCPVKWFTTGSRKVTHVSLMKKRLSGDAQVAETTVKRLLCCGFQRSRKAIGQFYQCWWRICREIHFFFQVRISHVLRFIYICELFTDS
jgi:hypothetical protein